MLDLTVTNFRNLRNVRVVDETNFSLIFGPNEGGKSSLIGSIQWAMTGTAFSRKGAEAEDLRTHGEEKMTGRIGIGAFLVNRTRTGGDSLKSVAERLGVAVDVLPLLFDPRMNGDGGCKAMKSFLDGAATSAFDCNIHFANDPAMMERINTAKRAGKTTTRQIRQYCEDMRAAQKTPPQPVLPAFPKPTEAGMAELRKAKELADQTVQATLADCNEATNLGSILAQIVQYRIDLVNHEKQRAAASTIDSLGQLRGHYQRIIGINENTLAAMAEPFKAAGFEDAWHLIDSAREMVTGTKAKVAALLASNPAPAAMPKQPPQLNEAADKTYNEIGGADLPAEDLNELIRNCAATASAAREVYSKAFAEQRQAQTNIDVANQQLGAWKSYEASIPAWEESNARLQAEWTRWDYAAKAIETAEIAHVNKAGDIFGNLVSEFSASILGGRKVKVSRDEGILLGPDRITDCSDSTRWRIEVAVMAAVGVLLKSPLLLVDGADILDPKNRQLVSNFLQTQIVPRFQHTIVTMTSNKKREEEPPSDDPTRFTKYWVENGELTKIGAR